MARQRAELAPAPRTRRSISGIHASDRRERRGGATTSGAACAAARWCSGALPALPLACSLPAVRHSHEPETFVAGRNSDEELHEEACPGTSRTSSRKTARDAAGLTRETAIVVELRHLRTERRRPKVRLPGSGALAVPYVVLGNNDLEMLRPSCWARQPVSLEENPAAET